MIIVGENIPVAFSETMSLLRAAGVPQDSRNGRVLSIPFPVMLQVSIPDERVLFDPIRNANPFFHVMEFVWMMAGSQDVNWIKQFNSRMVEFADHGTLRGAYGHRWRRTWKYDQIYHVIKLLDKDPGTRQAVIAMWHPDLDAPWRQSSDRPCNTHIYFRVIHGFLDMTVCNRSNDAVWGMTGANAVHMTLLHELVACATGFHLGKYRVFTNNLHYYTDLYPQGEQLLNITAAENLYQSYGLDITPLLIQGESYKDFVKDCEDMVHADKPWEMRTMWMKTVATPIYDAYMERLTKQGDGKSHISKINAEDWQWACSQWVERKDK